MAKKATKKPGLKQYQMDVIRIGAGAADLKRKSRPKQWKALVREAHARGVSIGSYIDTNTPMPLKERTQSSLRAEADKTMASAYAPVEQELSNRERMINSIGQKREMDNGRFQEWLTNRHAELQANAQAADAAVIARQQQIQSAMIQAQNANLDSFNMMNNATGQVSAPGASNAAQDINAQQNKLNAEQAASMDITNKIVGNNAGKQAQIQANNFAQMAAYRAKDVADQWKALQDVADDKDKVKLQRAADSAKEVSRLFDREISKAQTRNEQGIAAQSLGIKQQDLALDAAKFREGKRSNLADEATARARVRESKRATDLRLAQGDERNRIAWYNARHRNRGRGTNGEPKTAKNDPQTRFEEGYATLAASTRGKEGKPIDHTYVAKRASQLENQLVTKLKITRAMARTIVRAYLAKGGEDPGDYNQYTDSGSATTRR